MNKFANLAVTMVLIGATGCAVQTPTIAHTHVGHAITGFDGTPDDKGLFVIAEERALAAKLAADHLDPNGDVNAIRRDVDNIVEETASNAFGLNQAISGAMSHIVWATKSIDASSNLKQIPTSMTETVDAVVGRCDLIVLSANDVATSGSPEEIRILAGQIKELAIANHDDVGDFRRQLDALIAREQPRYEPVARWYLFHLVRLPNCDNCWSWRKWAKSSNRGY